MTVFASAMLGSRSQWYLHNERCLPRQDERVMCYRKMEWGWLMLTRRKLRKWRWRFGQLGFAGRCSCLQTHPVYITCATTLHLYSPYSNDTTLSCLKPFIEPVGLAVDGQHIRPYNICEDDSTSSRHSTSFNLLQRQQASRHLKWHTISFRISVATIRWSASHLAAPSSFLLLCPNLDRTARIRNGTG